MTTRNLKEAAAEILNKSIKNAPKDGPKAIKDPKEIDTGAPITKNTDPEKDYAKTLSKDSSEPTDDETAPEGMKKLDSGKNITKNAKAPEVDNDGVKKEDKDSEEDDDDDKMSDDSDDDDDDNDSGSNDDNDSEDDDSEDDADNDFEFDKKDKDMKEGKRKSMKEYVEAQLDFDVTEDIEAMFSGTKLTKEFVKKATTIFESAVKRKVREIETQMAEAFDTIIDEELERMDEEHSSRISDFMLVIAEEWLEENKIPLENNLRTELTEDFITGMRNLFLEHYIEVPESRIDIIEEMEEELAETRDKLNEEINEKIELHKYNKELERNIIFNDVVTENNLSNTQIDKLLELVEDVEFNNAEQYNEKLGTLIEGYFKKKNASSTLNEKLSEEKVEELVEDRNDDVAKMAKSLRVRLPK